MICGCVFLIVWVNYCEWSHEWKKLENLDEAYSISAEKDIIILRSIIILVT